MGSKLTHLRPADKEDKAGDGSDAIQPCDVRKIIKVVPDVVLQETHARLLSISLQSCVSFSTKNWSAATREPSCAHSQRPEPPAP